MPSSPPRFKEKEGSHESSSSSRSDSSPPEATGRSQETRPSSPLESSEQEQNIMLMGTGARLMSTRSCFSDDGHTRSDLPQSRGLLEIPTEATEEFVNEHRTSKPAQLHVDNSESAEHKKKNDITSTTASEHPNDHANREEMRHHQSAGGHIPDQPADPESEVPSTSASTRLQQQSPLSAETVRAYIKRAVADVASVASVPSVASVASAQPKDSPESEARKMSIGENNLASKKPRRKRKPQNQQGQSIGRWTVSEHREFLKGLRECGREWKTVALRIPTRSSAQIRSHAQKYFSKLQRDYESIVNHGDSSCAAALPAGAGEMRPSALRGADRILANPHAAEREVENTLEALRERYRQLQLRLEQRRQRRSNVTRAEAIEDDASASTNPRKRDLEEPESNYQSVDDQSSVSSAVSASVASISSARDLGDEELIALHVLGSDLARGDASTDGCSQGGPPGRKSPESSGRKSPESSGNSSASDSQDQSSPTKRHRKEG
jgi:SHAQKYF class myb-like DNA-binding protein